MAAPAIETEGLTRSFPSGVALDGLTIDVQPGEVLAVLGPNGAGKTTTVRLLDGVLFPDGGTARVLGMDPAADGDAIRRRTGVLTENAGLDDRLTARENLVFAARIRGFGKAEASDKAGELLDQFGMGDDADRAALGFSTGQRKRVALARALMHEPDVLFLDEPTSGLDPAATRDVVDLIGSLAAEHGRTVVLCTHFLGEAGRLADRMAVLQKGQLQAFGPPDEIAAGLWTGLDVELELAGPADGAALGTIDAVPGVLSSRPTDSGAIAVVENRDIVPRLVAALVHGGVLVYAATPRPPTLEDVYFGVLGDTAEVAA